MVPPSTPAVCAVTLLNDDAPQHPRMWRAVEVVGSRRVELHRSGSSRRDVTRIPACIARCRGVDHRAVVAPGECCADRYRHDLWGEPILEGIDGAVERKPAVRRLCHSIDRLSELNRVRRQIDLALRHWWSFHL